MAKQSRKVIDPIDQLAEDVKRSVVETCAKVAEIHVSDEAPIGWNAACRTIAAKIREL